MRSVETSGWASVPARVTVAALAAFAAGLFLPWVSVTAAFIGHLDVRIIDSPDGKLLLAGAVLLAGLFSWDVAAPSAWKRAGIGVALLAVGAGVGIDVKEVFDRVGEANDAADGFGVASVGTGLYVCAAAYFAVIAGLATHNGRAPAQFSRRAKRRFVAGTVAVTATALAAAGLGLLVSRQSSPAAADSGSEQAPDYSYLWGADDIAHLDRLFEQAGYPDADCQVDALARAQRPALFSIPTDADAVTDAVSAAMRKCR